MTPSRLFVLFCGFLLLAGAVHARIERTVEKTFAVQPGGTLTVDTSGGAIEVSAGRGDQVAVVAHLTFRGADSAAEADAIAEGLDLTIEQSGNDVRARAKYRKQRLFGQWGGSWPPVTVAFTVTVPERYNVDLRTSGGDIEVGDLTGRAKLQTSGGDLQLGQIDGPVDGHTSGGDIRLAKAGQNATLRTTGGNIQVRQAAGEVTADTSGGDITIEAARGAVQASTSGGDIRATVSGAITRDMDLSTSGGNVELTVDDSAAFELDARTSGGSIRAEQVAVSPPAGDRFQRGRLRGTVNGGGPRVEVRTSGGNISVRPSGD